MVDISKQSPVGFDFLETITNVNWGGGSWLGICLPRAGGVVNKTLLPEIDFIDQAGGTPGFLPVTVNNQHPTFASYVKPGPGPGHSYKVTAADLVGKLTANGGAHFTAFAVGLVDAEYGVLMMFKLDSDFPSDPFTVRIRWTGSTAPTSDVAVFTTQKGAVKAGLEFVSSFDIPTVAYDDQTVSTGTFHDFLVNPNTLAVTG